MSKRAAEPLDSSSTALKNRTRENPHADARPPAYDGELEDLPGDMDSEDDEEILVAGDSDDDSDADAREKMEVDEPAAERPTVPFHSQTRPRRENMEYDPSTYDMFHEFEMTWPCLSFDVVPDALGDERRGYPMTMYMVAGTQAAKARDNSIVVTKVSSLHRMNKDDSDEDDNDDDSDAEEERVIDERKLPHTTTTNRIRMSPVDASAASMGEDGNVYIWDISSHIRALDSGPAPPPQQNRPSAVLSMHGRVEGYALDWSAHPKEPLGKLATGDNAGHIHISTRREGGGWATSRTALRGHTGSVEELQWSPTERHVLASASSDGTVKIWDARAESRRWQLSVAVSSADVNVASWCRTVDHLLATGADDGVWGVWDLRTFPSSLQGRAVTATASFTHHQEPITSIEFHPTEDSVVAVASADGAITLWDLSVEVDEEEAKGAGGVAIPPQLMFDHRGLEDPKEVHWHRQAPGVLMATGGGGINIFKTFNI